MTKNYWKDHFISATELNSIQTKCVIIDCRFDLMNPAKGRQQYQQGHISAAHYFDLNKDLSSPIAEHGGRHPLPNVDAFVAKLSAAGVNSDTLIIGYDDQRFAFAARLWFLCHFIGHHNIKLLDGGFNAWKNAGFEIETETSKAKVANKRGTIQANIQANYLMHYEDVKMLSETEHAHLVLIDSREEPRYLGLQEPIDPIAGHIPTALNLPWVSAVDTNGHFLSSEEQLKRWEKFAPNEQELVVYCGSGVTACVNLLSLAVMGVDHAKLYSGSWSDWCSYHKTA